MRDRPAAVGLKIEMLKVLFAEEGRKLLFHPDGIFILRNENGIDQFDQLGEIGWGRGPDVFHGGVL